MRLQGGGLLVLAARCRSDILIACRNLIKISQTVVIRALKGIQWPLF